MLSRHVNSIAYRMTASVLILSLLLAVVSTVGIYLVSSREEAEKVEHDLRQLAKTTVPGINESLWVMDMAQLQVQLNSLLNVSHVTKVQVESNGRIVAAAGKDPAGEKTTLRTFPLDYYLDGRVIPQGSLQLQVNYGGISKDLLSKAHDRFLFQLGQIACVAVFMLFIFRQIVTRRLRAFESHITGVNNGGAGVLALPKPMLFKGSDELDMLVQAFNDMSTQVRELIDDLECQVRFMETLLQTIPLAVFYKDNEGRYLGCNEEFTRVTGVTKEEIAGKTVFELWPGELSETYHRQDLELLRHPAVQVYDFKMKSAAGTVLDVVYHKNVYLDENGRVAGIIGAFLDITERKRAVETLHVQTVELEQEVAERQRAQEALQLLNRELEQRVALRTAELSEKNAELQSAYDNLKITQAKLLQQDKMASIGQLAAGVAHEINNPMGFISSNLSSLGRYLEKLTAYLDAGERLVAGAPELAEVLSQQRKELKIDRILQDLPALIGESRDGAERVRRIVQDLKSFSRLDSAEFVGANVNDGLESTLAIVWNELKYKTTVTKEYGDLPKVSCNLGQLNQVFMNLLVNAAQAIESRGEIRIRTWCTNDDVCVSISDTGCGISGEARKKIFDPFYTTKEVGKGTGLGLAIAYDIVVNKHRGTIEVESAVGKGTTFLITLPLNSKEGS